MVNLKSISAKLLVAITVAVLLPFLGFYFFVRWEMGNRLSRDVVVYFLKSKVSDMANQIDDMVAERKTDLRIWVESPQAQDLLLQPGNAERLTRLEQTLNQFCVEKKVYDLILLADANGKILATNTIDRDKTFLAPDWMETVRSRSVQEAPWFRTALGGEFARQNWHVSSLLHGNRASSRDPADYGIGFAGPVRHPRTGEILGVWYNLVNWRFIQVDILDQVNKYFRDLQTPESYRSGYSWLWKSDADTIIAHKNRDIYSKTVSGPDIRLGILTQAALSERWGVFPEYEFPPGTKKNAAFKWTRTEREGGFGWIVGIGIDNSDIFATVQRLGQDLMLATLLILAGILLWIWIISRTITRPVKNLISSTQEIAKGNLEARVPVETEDEIGVLANSFNAMTEDLEKSRAKLIRAEKEAAWREMARQIAHEIKNPLTPMRLSTSLLQKAYRDKSPEFEKIFDQTTGTVLRQIDSLRRIASDFSTFAGKPMRKPEVLEVTPLLRDSLGLYEAWAREKNIDLEVAGRGGPILADPEEIKRVLINLVDNAFEAVEKDGRVSVRLENEGKDLRMEIRDSGPGIPPETRQRLFEPYFSTKTQGTGLGLAIIHRIITELGGTIQIDCPAEGGTVVEVRIPLHGTPA